MQLNPSSRFAAERQAALIAEAQQDRLARSARRSRARRPTGRVRDLVSIRRWFTRPSPSSPPRLTDPPADAGVLDGSSPTLSSRPGVSLRRGADEPANQAVTTPGRRAA